MAYRFREKVVVVTGSSAGIGRDAAVEFSREGASLVIQGQDVERLQQTANLVEKAGVRAENILQLVGSMEDERTPERIISEAIAKFRHIDVLVSGEQRRHGAEAGSDGPVGNLDFLYRVNLRSIVQLTHLDAPHLERTKGNIINVCSISSLRAYPTLKLYGSMKAPLDHVTRNDTLILGLKGIRVNAISPGLIRTEVISRHQGLHQSKFEKYANDNAPLGRIGLPSEMTSVLKFLASSEASYVNGAIWVVDGGVSLHTNPLILV